MRSQHSLRANQLTLRSWRRSSVSMRCPMCIIRCCFVSPAWSVAGFRIQKKDVGVSTFAHPTRRLSHCLRFRISNAVGPRHCILRNSPVCFWLSGRGHNTPGMDVPLPYLQKRFQICEICALKTTFVNVLFAMGNLCNVCKSADAASPFLNHKSTHSYHAGRLSREQM